ncbi:tetratricopeptide repeat protein [Piscinibacter terrae]|uniref:tetratricopeptide repeat protein n=1 Tax=Piscinibacter terrae TaxID=2496871 RepID=UPI000F5A67C3|nr:tetratricopeptide repeat protein [Albitalea terrae]
MKVHVRLIGAALLAFSAAALAAGGGGGSSGGANDDPVVVAAKAAIEKKDWAGAQAQLKQALAAKPNNADYHNLYAYSMRKGPNPDMDLVFKHYNEALRINPKHTGAHEYIGEAYLQVGDLAKAKEHLAALNKICFFGCEEYSDLKKDIAEYEASHKQ